VFLAGSQKTFEANCKRNVLRKYGIDFNGLYSITNMPIELRAYDLVGRPVGRFRSGDRKVGS